jgi:hypothetical protein
MTWINWHRWRFPSRQHRRPLPRPQLRPTHQQVQWLQVIHQRVLTLPNMCYINCCFRLFGRLACVGELLSVCFHIPSGQVVCCSFAPRLFSSSGAAASGGGWFSSLTSLVGGGSSAASASDPSVLGQAFRRRAFAGGLTSFAWHPHSEQRLIVALADGALVVGQFSGIVASHVSSLAFESHCVHARCKFHPTGSAEDVSLHDSIPVSWSAANGVAFVAETHLYHSSDRQVPLDVQVRAMRITCRVLPLRSLSSKHSHGVHVTGPNNSMSCA